MNKQELLDEYILAHATPEHEQLTKISRQTHLEVLNPRMVSGHLQGQILKLICQMIKPNRILEIGAFTGYSAVCFAQGTTPDCIIDTIEVDDELETRLRNNFKEADVAHKINLHIGDALEIIKTLNHQYDLVFIDGDKREYIAYYNQIFDKVKNGGFILADNVLWDNKVIEPINKKDTQTQSIIEFNNYIKNDIRVEKAILPLRDGLYLIRKL